MAAAGPGREDHFKGLRNDRMLPTLAERLREQQAKTRSRPQSRQPWPLPTEPPTALLFQAPQAVASPVAVDPPEAVVPPEALPSQPQARRALAEMLLLLFWTGLVLLDGVLALASLIDRVASPERRSPETHPQRITPEASSCAAVPDPPVGTEATEVLQGCSWLSHPCGATL